MIDLAARAEDTTFEIHRGVMRRGCPILSERKGGLSFSSVPRKLRLHDGKSDLQFITFKVGDCQVDLGNGFGCRNPAAFRVRVLTFPHFSTAVANEEMPG